MKPDENGVENEQDEAPSVSSNPLDSLKTSVLNLFNDLRDGYLTSIDGAVFEPKVVSSDSLNSLVSSLFEI